MPNQALVSIIIPIYKVEKYIDKCLASVMGQTYRHLEVILVDDGSPDRCGAICDSYAQRDERIRVIHKENGGLSSARNAGLDVCKGESIFFLDSDDHIALNTIERLVSAMERDKSDIVCCNFQMVNEDGTCVDGPEGYVDEVLMPEQYQRQSYDDRYFVTSIVVWNKLYRRKTVEGLRFPVGKTHEDEFFSYRAIEHADKITTLADKLHFYLQRGDSIMGAGVSVRSLDAVEAYLQKAEWYRDKGDNYLMYRALRQACGALAKKKQQLDMKDETVRRRYAKLKRGFFRILLRDGIGRVPLACFVAGGALLVSEKLLLRISGKG